jgi:enhancing lycopene biosynthesis protein 2
VIDHQVGQPQEDESRDIRRESARIARGPVRDVAEISAAEIDAVLLPGGFGAAKNLCDFAVAGADCRVAEPVASFLRAVHDAGKPIGAMCIAPVILARTFGGQDRPRLTIGRDAETAAAIEAMGAEHVPCTVGDHVIDEKHKFVTTPAYMLADDIVEVFDGAEGFVKALLALCR